MTSSYPTLRTFEISNTTRKRTDSHLFPVALDDIEGYEVVFKEDGKVCFSTFFASEWVNHKGATFDVGFEQACMMGHNFIGGGNG